jgi:hypothetical protein
LGFPRKAILFDCILQAGKRLAFAMCNRDHNLTGTDSLEFDRSALRSAAGFMRNQLTISPMSGYT